MNYNANDGVYHRNGRKPQRLPIKSSDKKPGNKIDVEIGGHEPDNRMIVYPFRCLSSPEANSDKAHKNNKGCNNEDHIRVNEKRDESLPHT